VAKGRWLQGSGSPSPGRPIHSRQRIAEALLRDLAVVWEAQGKEVLERLAKDEPAKLAQIAYGLLPRDTSSGGVGNGKSLNVAPKRWGNRPAELVDR
jgi:hypothetical protein